MNRGLGRRVSRHGCIGLLLCLVSVTCTQAQTVDTEALRERLAGPQREVADQLRDPTRRPVEVLTFLGIAPGMRVLDIYAANGYYTVILGLWVGPSGHVYAQNPPVGVSDEPHQVANEGFLLETKVQRAGLGQVTHLRQPATALDIPPSSLDAVMVVQILHDHFHANRARAVALLTHAADLLKPGGVLGIIDHEGRAGEDNARLHRMTRDEAVAVAREAGLEWVADSDLLDNPRDSQVRSIFDPSLNRNTDRFLIKLRKPAP